MTTMTSWSYTLAIHCSFVLYRSEPLEQCSAFDGVFTYGEFC